MSASLDDTFATLKHKIRGELILPGSPNYDEARTIWNAMIDKRPAAIVRCAGVADVVAAVNFAREAGITLAVRGGGHNIAGNALCDGGTRWPRQLARRTQSGAPAAAPAELRTTAD